jgi:hypothetical protein
VTNLQARRARAADELRSLYCPSKALEKDVVAIKDCGRELDSNLDPNPGRPSRRASNMPIFKADNFVTIICSTPPLEDALVRFMPPLLSVSLPRRALVCRWLKGQPFTGG